VTVEDRAVLDEIRARVDLVDLVGAVVPLKRAGERWKGLCPFHQEKTPSFTVHPKRGRFYCFGCHVGGDAVDFLRRHEGVTFPVAVRRLAERAGIDLDRVDRPSSAPARQWSPPAPPAPGIDPEIWREAWPGIVQEARRQQARLEPYREVFEIADWIRVRRQTVAAARRRASTLGNVPEAWALEVLANRVATDVAQIEAELG
jgi:hypothetical protein